MARFLAPALALLLGASHAGAAVNPWAQVSVAEERPDANATNTTLVVQNRALSAVSLQNCAEKHAVQPGANLSLALANTTGFWIVPDGVEWDCHQGPFDLFYVHVNFTGQELVATVGYGWNVSETDGVKNESQSHGNASSGIEQWGSKISGVEFSGGPSGTANNTARCRVDDCEQGESASSLPENLTLTIMGPQPSLLSYWRGGRRGGGWGRGGRGRWGRGGGGGWGGGGWGGCGWGCR